MGEAGRWDISRWDFLRAAGTVGISGVLLGVYSGQARGHDGGEQGGRIHRRDLHHVRDSPPRERVRRDGTHRQKLSRTPRSDEPLC